MQDNIRIVLALSILKNKNAVTTDWIAIKLIKFIMLIYVLFMLIYVKFIMLIYFPETALNFTQNKPGPVEYTWEENPAEYFQYTRKIFLNQCRQFRRARIVLKWVSYFAYFTTFRNKIPPINLYFPESALNFTQNKPGPVEYTWEENPAEYFQYARKIFLNRCRLFRYAEIILKWFL